MADDKTKKKAVNAHERLQSSLSKFRENMAKIREVTDAVDSPADGKESETKEEKQSK